MSADEREPAAWGLAYPDDVGLAVVEISREEAEEWRVADDDPRVLVPLYRKTVEDEAAVERADPILGYYARVRALDPSAEMLAVIEAGEADRRAALAAARGLQTGAR